jgi:hypothetical protein
MIKSAVLLLLGLVSVSVNAGFDEGMSAIRGQDAPAAISEFIPLAEKGSVVAQFQLGLI